MIAIVIGLHEISINNIFYITWSVIALGITIFISIYYENGEPWARISFLVICYISIPLFARDIFDFSYLINTTSYVIWGYTGAGIEIFCIICSIFTLYKIYKDKKIDDPFKINEGMSFENSVPVSYDEEELYGP